MRTKTIVVILFIALMAVSIGVTAANSSQAATAPCGTTTGVCDNLATCPNIATADGDAVSGNNVACPQSSDACCNSN
ncbi:MAG: hypothetical protein KAR76_02380 [Methanosarcinales archaeon]|nr:hypothetical protein [Methanosarcinales archaeon]